MTRLVRTRSGIFTLDRAYKLDDIQKYADSGTVDKIVMPVDEIFSSCPSLSVYGEEKKRVMNGNPLFIQPQGERVRVYLDGTEFAAVYDHSPEKQCYMPFKMFLDQTDIRNKLT